MSGPKATPLRARAGKVAASRCDWETRGQMLSKAILPNATMTRTCPSNSSSRARYGLQLETSSGCGLFSGGAQWSTAVM